MTGLMSMSPLYCRVPSHGHCPLCSTAHVAPSLPAVRRYQCRLMLLEPIAVNRTQVVSGVLSFKANDSYSYDLMLTGEADGLVAEAGRDLEGL